MGGSGLDTLSANWSGFSDATSGIASYRYSIGTVANGTDVVSWTSVGTSTAVTVTGLTLRTNRKYFFNVVALDVAGNTSTVVSSRGQVQAPTLSLTLSTQSLTFDLTPAAGPDTQSLDVTTWTNAYGGYTVQLRSENDPLTTGGSVFATTFPGTWASPQTWSGYGMGYTSNDISVAGSDRFAGSTLFAALPTTAPDTAADNPGPIAGAPDGDTFRIDFRAEASLTQAAGAYRGRVVVTAMPTF